MTGNSICDSFSMERAHISLAVSDYATDVTKEKSDIIIGPSLQMLLACITLGRNIIQNIRKFVTFQLTVGLNLCLYVVLGSFLYRDFSIQPVIILNINFLMDTFGAMVLATEMPMTDHKGDLQLDELNWGKYGILRKTKRFNPK